MSFELHSSGCAKGLVPKLSVKVKRQAHFKGPLPCYESPQASGFDVRAQLKKPLLVPSMQRVLIPTGLSFEIPPGFEFQVRSRSGLSLRQGLCVANSPGTIDADYRGELKIIVINYSSEVLEIKDQQRVAQVVLCPVFQVQWEDAKTLGKTFRGGGGFGSTGS